MEWVKSMFTSLRGPALSVLISPTPLHAGTRALRPPKLAHGCQPDQNSRPWPSFPGQPSHNTAARWMAWRSQKCPGNETQQFHVSDSFPCDKARGVFPSSECA